MFERIDLEARRGRLQKIADAKKKKVFDEWKEGKLRSGSKHGPVVEYEGKPNPQAIAIAISEAKKAVKEAKKRKRK